MIFIILYFAFPFLGLIPDKPRKLNVTNITSRTAVISWLDPENQRTYVYFSRFFIKVKRENALIWGIATGKVNEFKLNNLIPNTNYKISVSAGNRYRFGEESVTSFLTSEEGECEIRVLLKRSHCMASNNYFRP